MAGPPTSAHFTVERLFLCCYVQIPQNFKLLKGKNHITFFSPHVLALHTAPAHIRHLGIVCRMNTSLTSITFNNTFGTSNTFHSISLNLRINTVTQAKPFSNMAITMELT